MILDFDYAMISTLVGLSAGVWLFVNRLFLKTAVKQLVQQVYGLVTGWKPGLISPYDRFEHLAVWLVVVLTASILIAMTQAVDMYIVAEDLPNELAKAGVLEEATFVRAFLNIEPIKYGLLWYGDLLATIAFIAAGSQLWHRIERLLSVKYEASKGVTNG